MIMFRQILLTYLSCSTLLCVVLSNVINSNVLLDSVDRVIDGKTQLINIRSKITFSNKGKNPLSKFIYAVEPEFKDHLVNFGATTGKSDKTDLALSPITIENYPDVLFYSISLAKPLAPGLSQTIEVSIVLGKILTMFPTHVTQRQSQLVLLEYNLHMFSPYKCSSSSTKIILPSGKVESYTTPATLSGSTLTYVSSSNLEAFSKQPLRIHYENNSPFLIVTRLERTLEISMWGNIAVEETIDIRHAGAVLKGGFSRFDMQRAAPGDSNSGVASFNTILPAAAKDIYYRDDIGNISTSALRSNKNYMELIVRPRFPLYGGWKTHYMLGYNVPSYEYLYHLDRNGFVLNMRMLDHVFDNMLVEEFSLTIILPEGSTIMDIEAPFRVNRDHDKLHYTYLDTTGRPTLSMRNINLLSEKDIGDFQLKFKFSRVRMIMEPLLLIVSFMLCFLATIVYVRLDFTLSKDVGTEIKLKAAALCEKIVQLQNGRSNMYDQFDAAIVALKTSKDLSTFQGAVKKIGVDHKNKTQSIGELNISLKALAPDLSDKVVELVEHDKTVRSSQLSQAGLVEKLVQGKLQKQQFIEQDGLIDRKKSESLQRVQAIIRVL